MSDLHTLLNSDNGKDYLSRMNKFTEQTTIPTEDALAFLVIAMVEANIESYADEDYTMEMPDSILSMSGEALFNATKDWAKNAEDAADILSLTADDAAYDGILSLIDWLGEVSSPEQTIPTPPNPNVEDSVWGHCDKCGKAYHCDDWECDEETGNNLCAECMAELRQRRDDADFGVGRDGDGFPFDL